MSNLDTYDLKLIEATQAGLPIVEKPYEAIASQTGLSEQDVIDRLSRLLKQGIIRKIAAAPNHYALGLCANGMTVWDVDDRFANEKGQLVGALDFVSHCYLRPRALPHWPYNLFAMVHGRSREEVESKRKQISKLLGDACTSDDILYSKRILKKTGLRVSPKGA